MPTIQPHHATPTERCKYWPGIHRHSIPHLLWNNPSALLDTQLRPRQHDARENIGDDLLIHAGLDSPAEDGIAPNETGKEGIMRRFRLLGRGVAKEEHARLVKEGVGCEVASMRAGGLEDEGELGTKGQGRAEEKDHSI